jgi:protein transport protein YIF1
MANFYNQSRSPPPLQHPVPTHPAYIPEPPSTPSSPTGYQRYVSSPPVPNAPLHQQPAYNPNPAYAQQQQQHYGSPPRQQPPPQMRAGGPQIPAPDFSAWGMNDATTQFGMQLGQSAVAAGQEYVQKNVSSSADLACASLR